MFILSSSYTKQQGFTTYLDQLKNCCPKLSHESVCQYWPKTEQLPANWPISQNTNLKKTFVQYLCDKTKNLIVSCHDCPAILWASCLCITQHLAFFPNETNRWQDICNKQLLIFSLNPLCFLDINSSLCLFYTALWAVKEWGLLYGWVGEMYVFDDVTGMFVLTNATSHWK